MYFESPSSLVDDSASRHLKVEEHAEHPKRKIPMKYPKEFVDAVKAEFPGWQDLHMALDTGRTVVGQYLDDNRSGGFRPEHLVKMIDEGRVAELKAEAEKQIRRIKLYSQWCKLYEAQQPG